MTHTQPTLRGLFIGLLALPLILTGGCATNPVTGGSDFVLMSEDQELAMGRKSHAEILEEYSLYDDDRLQAYVQRIGTELAGQSHRSELVYRFTVVDSEKVNAFALPGGYIYITRGLLAHLNSEDELAAVLGHELGHVTARHSVRQYSARTAASIGYGITSLFVPQLRSQGGSELFDVLGSALINGYGRGHELEADELGAEYLARAGRDPEAMLTVIGTLKNQEVFEKQLAKKEGREARTYHGVFASHPDNDTRLQELISKARLKQAPTGRVATDNAAFLSYLEGLRWGPSEAEGVLRGVHFYHGDLGFGLDFPPGWRVKNIPDKLVAAAPELDGIFQLTVHDLQKRQTPRDFMTQALKVKKLANGETLDINGLRAYTGFGKGETAWGERLVRYTTVFLQDKAYVFASATKDSRAPRKYDPSVLASTRSFHALTPKERRLASGMELTLFRAGRGTRYDDLASKSRIPTDAEDHLRLLNGDYPDGEPAKGRTIKLVQ